MTTLKLHHAPVRPVPGTAPGPPRPYAALLWCGVAAAALYAGMVAFVGMFWPEYRAAAQTVSELSAIGAPTRTLWMYLGAAYNVLVAAFGIGILLSAGARRPARVAGWVMVVHGVLGFFYPPMHLRGAPMALTDTLHIVFGTVTVALMIVAIGFGGQAFGAWFRRFSLATLGVVVAFGFLTGLDAPKVAKNLPTPWIGVWERVSVAAFLVWMAAFAVALLRDRRNAPAPGGA